MAQLRCLLDSKLLFCALLALPALPMLAGLLAGTARYYALLPPAGEFAARFLVLALMVTPLRLLFPRQGWTLWLQRRRRYLGVAAFAYAVAHTIFYVLDRNALPQILVEVFKLPYWTGWLALLIFVPLAATSNDWSTRQLGRAWKSLQRLAYPAAVLTLVHWLLITREPGAAVVHFAPLALLEAWRLWHDLSRRRTAEAAPLAG